MECEIKENRIKCRCTYPGCPRKGKCCECVEYHRGRVEIVGCFFSPKAEKTYDRTIKKFIEDQS